MNCYWQVIDHVEISDKMKQKFLQFFQALGYVGTTVWLHYLDSNKTPREIDR